MFFITINIFLDNINTRMTSAEDAMKFMSEQSGFSEDVSGAMGMASSAYSNAKNAYEAVKGNKQALGQTLELSAGGVFAGAKYLNKTTGLPDQAQEGVDNISAYFDKLKTANAVADDPASTITSQGGVSPQELLDAQPEEPQLIGTAGKAPGEGGMFGEGGAPWESQAPPSQPTQEQMDLTADDEPLEPIESGGIRSAAADTVDVTTDASVAAGATTAEATGADAAAEAGLEVAGAALDATGIGAVAGIALEAAAVLGPAIAGLVELFGGHTKAPSPTPPDLSGIAVPTFQAGVN